MDIKNENNNFSFKEVEDFFNDTVDQFHTRPDEDPLTVEMIINALKKFIDLKRNNPENN